MKGLLVIVALAAVPAIASGHEVLHQIERSRAIAVKAYFADGELLSNTEYEIYSPSDPKTPYQQGRTDRNGWLSFVPDVPGTWRVRVVEPDGHGLTLEVDAGPASADREPPERGGRASAFVLRPLVGLAVIAAVFAILVTRHRRKGPPR